MYPILEEAHGILIQNNQLLHFWLNYLDRATFDMKSVCELCFIFS